MQKREKKKLRHVLKIQSGRIIEENKMESKSDINHSS
jgi:hypothetical protein